jgi:single-stranded-DNA-specific exonuclease
MFRAKSRAQGEGYGLNIAAMEEAARAGIKLILTADCGIRDIEAVTRANELGVDIIITDHHEPGTELPPALAVINPKRHDSQYPFKELSGCGVAFK